MSPYFEIRRIKFGKLVLKALLCFCQNSLSCLITIEIDEAMEWIQINRACASISFDSIIVAITRSYRALYIMHSGNLSSLFDAVPKDVYDTTLSSGTKLQL